MDIAKHKRLLLGGVAAFVVIAVAIRLGGARNADSEPELTEDMQAAPIMRPAEDQKAPAEQRTVLASRESTTGMGGFTQLRADLRSVERSGRLVRANITVTNVKTGVFPWKPGSDLSSAPGADADSSPDDVSGMTMTDAANAKLYPVVRDQAGQCVCSRNLRAANVSEGSSIDIFVTFGAPPPEVSQVDINVPMFGTFNNVTMSS